MKAFEAECLAKYTPCHFKSREEVVRALAEVHAEFVLIHPFREGNGRIARVLTTLVYSMKQRKAKRGIATLCLGGGNGVALAVERP